MSQGQVDKAINILKKVERVNKTHVDEKLYEKFKVSTYLPTHLLMEKEEDQKFSFLLLLQDDCQKQKKLEEVDKNYSVLDLFSNKRLRRVTLLLIIIW